MKMICGTASSAATTTSTTTSSAAPTAAASSSTSLATSINNLLNHHHSQQQQQLLHHHHHHHRLNGTASSPHSADSNAPTSSQQSLLGSVISNVRNLLAEGGQITPSISLIPIKQVQETRLNSYNLITP